MIPQAALSSKKSWGTFAGLQEGRKTPPKQKESLSNPFAIAQRDKLQVGNVLFCTRDYNDSHIRCSREVRNISSANSLTPPSDGYTWVRWEAEFISTVPSLGKQTFPLSAQIVSRDLALAEDADTKSVVVCRRNSNSFDSIRIHTMSDECKWSWAASATGDLLGAVTSVNWWPESRNAELIPYHTNIEIWDLSEGRSAGIQPANIEPNIDLPFSSRLFISRDGNMQLYAETGDQKDALAVWRKQEVPQGSGFFCFQPDARFDQESYFKNLVCANHLQSACRPEISELVCSDDNNKIAIGWRCRSSKNLFFSIIENSILVRCGLAAGQFSSRSAFKHMMFSPCATWLVFFCKSKYDEQEYEESAKLLGFDGPIQPTYNIPGEGPYDNPCFSPDSALFAYTTQGRAAFMNVSTLSHQPGSVSQFYSFPSPLGDNRIDSLDFSPRPEKNLLLAVSEGKITFWQFEPDPRWVGILDLVPHAFFLEAVFSSDGSCLMALDKNDSNIHFLTPKRNRGEFILSRAGFGGLET